MQAAPAFQQLNQQLRFASAKKKAAAKAAPDVDMGLRKRIAARKAERQKKKSAARTSYKQYDLRAADRFPLLDAMRYVLAHSPQV